MFYKNGTIYKGRFYKDRVELPVDQPGLFST